MQVSWRMHGVMPSASRACMCLHVCGALHCWAAGTLLWDALPGAAHATPTPPQARRLAGHAMPVLACARQVLPGYACCWWCAGAACDPRLLNLNAGTYVAQAREDAAAGGDADGGGDEADGDDASGEAFEGGGRGGSNSEWVTLALAKAAQQQEERQEQRQQ